MDYYNTISSSYDELHGEEQIKKLSLIKPFLDSKSILDIGCGTGIASPHGSVGIDPSEELLKLNPNYPEECILGSVERLPFQDKSFDIITCLTAIHHFDLNLALEEMKRVAKKKVIISVLRKSNKFEEIVDAIKESFKVTNYILEEKDVIMVCQIEES